MFAQAWQSHLQVTVFPWCSAANDILFVLQNGLDFNMDECKASSSSKNSRLLVLLKLSQLSSSLVRMHLTSLGHFYKEDQAIWNEIANMAINHTTITTGFPHSSSKPFPPEVHAHSFLYRKNSLDRIPITIYCIKNEHKDKTWNGELKNLPGWKMQQPQLLEESG